MHRLLLTGAACLTLCACASAPKLAVCDGRHRRPANPHGSVLTGLATEAAAPPPVARSVPPHHPARRAHAARHLHGRRG